MGDAIIYVIKGTPPYLVVIALMLVSTAITIIAMFYLYLRYKAQIVYGKTMVDLNDIYKDIKGEDDKGLINSSEREVDKVGNR